MRLKVFSLIVFVYFFVSCSTPEKNVRPEGFWYSQMHRLSELHLKLTPMVADETHFSDPSQRVRIQSLILELVEISENLVQDPKAPNADPLISYVSVSMETDVKRAHQAFLSHDLTLSRRLLSSTTQYCIACHTKNDRGVQNYPLRWEPALGALSQNQKVDFYLANRQYGTGLKEAFVLAEQRYSETWWETLKRSLMVLIRVKKDPAETEKLVKLIGANSNVPSYLKKDSEAWLRDLAGWKKSANPETDKGKFKLVEHLYKAGQKGEEGLVKNLRSSALLHELMENTKSELYGKSLLMMGRVSEALHQTGLARFYFESCVYEEPHSQLAELCYREYFSSVQRNNPYYKESNDIKMHLIELQRESSPPGPLETEPAPGQRKQINED